MLAESGHSEKLLSVIIPCSNVASTVGEAVASVIGQEFEKLEIILVENHSTDNTLEVLLTLKEKHPQLIRVLKEEKKGAPHARNKGLMESVGDFIQFLDADDLLLLPKLNHQIGVAEIHRGPVVVCGGFTLKRGVEVTDIFPSLSDEVFKSIFTSSLGCTSSMLFSHHIRTQKQLWNPTFQAAQEYQYLFDLATSGFAIVPDPTLLTIKRELPTRSISKNLDVVAHNRLKSRVIQLEWMQRNKPHLLHDPEIIQHLVHLCWFNARNDAGISIDILRNYVDGCKSGSNVYSRLKKRDRMLIRILGRKNAFQLKNFIKLRTKIQGN